MHQSALQQLRHDRLAQPFDVHHAARGEVEQAAGHARRAGRIDAAMVGLALGPLHLRPAHRALRRELEMFCPPKPVREHLHHLGDHIAAALDSHGVAD